MTSLFRPQLAIVVAISLATFEGFGYEAPLSDEAVREAYFLGQRRDETTAHLLETYRRYFPIPKSGPQIYSVELFRLMQKLSKPQASMWQITAPSKPKGTTDFVVTRYE